VRACVCETLKKHILLVKINAKKVKYKNTKIKQYIGLEQKFVAFFFSLKLYIQYFCQKLMKFKKKDFKA